MRKKTLAIILSLVLLLGFSIPIQAVNPPELQQNIDDELVLRYAYTNHVVTNLSIASNIAYIDASLSGYPGTTTKVEITAKLQKKTLLFFWSDVESWSGTFNTYRGSIYKAYGVSSGTYRVVATYKAYSGSASETINAQSGNATCP